MNDKKYSFLRGLKKAMLMFIIFAIPFFINAFPDFVNLTIGGALVLGLNWLKVKYGLNI